MGEYRLSVQKTEHTELSWESRKGILVMASVLELVLSFVEDLHKWWNDVSHSRLDHCSLVTPKLIFKIVVFHFLL